MKKLYLIYVLLAPYFATSQSVKGKVIDLNTQQGVAYVNIGVVGKGVGTVSDSEGNFELSLDATYNQDTLMMSIIGYESLTMKVLEAKKQCQPVGTFLLKKANYTLREVNINATELTRKIVGIDDPKDGISIGFEGKGMGMEMGTLIKNKKTCILQKVTFYVSACKSDSIFFRLNIYDEKDGAPNNSILNAPIYLSCACQDILKIFEVDLTDKQRFSVWIFNNLKSIIS